MKKISLLFAFLISFTSINAIEFDPKKYFENEKGCFVLHELYTKNYFKVFDNNCDVQYSPASTYKIPHALIGLETGSIEDPNNLVPWNGHKYWSKHWNQDHTLYTAMKYSVVPYFVNLAAKVGPTEMELYLKKFDYGNQHFSKKGFLLNWQLFWLNNELKISANEQIDFLKKMYENRLAVQIKHLNIVKDSLVQQKGTLSNSLGENAFVLNWGSKAILSAKTGATDDVGWIVGHIKTAEKEFVFSYVTTLKHRKFKKAMAAANQLLNDYYTKAEEKCENCFHYTRLGVDNEGHTYFAEESINLNLWTSGLAMVSLPQTSDVVRFFMAKPNWQMLNLHHAPKRQYLLVLQGILEIQTSLDVKKQFKQGNVLLVEDTYGYGHRTRNAGDMDLILAWVSINR